MVYDNTAQNAPSAPKNRMCPNARGCWPSLSYHSWSLRNTDPLTLARRICMILILGLRTAISVFSVIRDAFGAHIANLIIGIILGVLGFFFIAWCLQTIGDVTGTRRVFGMMFGRMHFDAFLLVCALLHVGIFSGYFVGANGITLWVLWTIMWLVIWAVAWVATWEPEQESRSAGIV